MLDFFKHFGAVRSTNIQYRYCEENHDCESIINESVLVEFSDSKVANALITQGRIRIYKLEFEVKPKNESNTNHKRNEQVVVSSQAHTAPEDAPDNIMNALNDDCLGLIFEKLDLADVISVLNVCKRFKRIAKETFPSNIRRECVDIGRLVRTSDFYSVYHLFRVFGSSFMSVSFSCYDLDHGALNVVLRGMSRYCNNLNSLKLQGKLDDINHRTLTGMQPLLSNLKRLYIRGFGKIATFEHFVSACTQVEFLEIYTNLNVASIPSIRLPKLVKLRVHDTLHVIDELLDINPQIEELTVHYHLIKKRLAANKLKIPKLILNVMDHMLDPFERIYLKDLKNAEIHMKAEVADAIKANILPMTNITRLSHAGYDDYFDEDLLMETTQKLHNLNRLDVHLTKIQVITTDVLKRMLHNAKHLLELHISLRMNSLFVFEEKDYYDLLKVVKNRGNNKKLTIEIECKGILTGKRNIKCINFNMAPNWLNVSLIYRCFD